MEIIKQVTENLPAFTLLGTFLAGVWTVVQFAINKRAENQRQRFETYHDLIKRLVVGDSHADPFYADRQIAVAYELRRFREYFPVTRRILEGLQQSWQQSPNKGAHRVLSELSLTIAYIDSKKCSLKFWRPNY